LFEGEGNLSLVFDFVDQNEISHPKRYILWNENKISSEQVFHEGDCEAH